MSTELLFGRDQQGYNTYAPAMPDDIRTATLAASSAASVTVPSNAPVWVMYVRIEPTKRCWISATGTAAVPVGGTFSASGSDLIVGTVEYKRTVYAGDVLSFITAETTCDIAVDFYIAVP